MTSVSSDQHHLAGVLSSKDSGIKLVLRPTPAPGPNELLVEVKSIAINPLDWIQCYHGFGISSYPAVVGSDVAGIVVSVGSPVPSDAPKPGTRVAAFASAFFKNGAPDYGAFQKYVLVPTANVVPLPSNVNFNEGSLLPMAVLTSWAGWYTVGLPRNIAYTAADKQGMLIWGGASSVGSAAIQIAKLIGFTVYTTASEKNHEYLKSLGASRTFDYKAKDVVEKIINAAKEEGLTFQWALDAAGQAQSCQEILSKLKGSGVARVASAPQLPKNLQQFEDIEVKFILSPNDEHERTDFFHFVFGVWLKEKLATSEFVSSPKVRVVSGGLESLQKAVDEWRMGVSGTKLVVEVE